MKTPPHFLPPNTPAPLINLTTGAGIKRAIPIFARSVARGDAYYADALDTLMGSYVRHVWRGDLDALNRNHERLEKRLLAAIDAASAVTPSPDSPAAAP